MNEPYEEIVEGESLMRLPPGARHEAVRARLHGLLERVLNEHRALRLLAPRTVVSVGPGSLLRPDIAVIHAANRTVWLAVEVIDSDDHQTDTVVKKAVYEDSKIPKLWMVDPRYNNVELYGSTEYGMALQRILAGREALEDAELGGFQVVIRDLFAD